MGPTRQLTIRQRLPFGKALAALGIVYGDIGTSPLYAFREAFAAEDLPASVLNVYGILSLIFWALIIIISIKYLLLVMRADNEKEGGILALTALNTPGGIRPPERRRYALILVGLFGTALLYGDGIITPAISVLSAVEGVGVATPVLEAYVIPIAITILVALFLIQRHGTTRIGSVFGPVMLIWFSVIGFLGLYQVLQNPRVLRAINPEYAVSFFARNRLIGFLALGAVFLVVTGGEALYADMGHFGRRPIFLGWFTLVMPCLLLNYFGQGALLIKDPLVIDNPFYRMAPQWALWPLLILATSATVIASQALISGAFSLTRQAIQLGYLPRMRVDHTSHHEVGQIYVPLVNYALLVACVGLVIGFGSSSALAAAYGVAVTATMAITTMLFYVFVRERWRWPFPVAVVVLSGFFMIDLAFFGANLFKIPDGGWFPLAVGLLVFTILTTWKKGRSLLRGQLRRGELPIERFISSVADSKPSRVPGTGIYMYAEPGETPPILLANLRHFGTLHERIVVLSVVFADVPHVPPVRRVTVHDLGDDFHQVVLKYGFQDDPDVPQALANMVTHDLGLRSGQVRYFLAGERVIPTGQPGMSRWRERLYALMHRNSMSAARFFRLPSERAMEIGMQVEI